MRWLPAGEHRGPHGGSQQIQNTNFDQILELLDFVFEAPLKKPDPAERSVSVYSVYLPIDFVDQTVSQLFDLTEFVQHCAHEVGYRLGFQITILLDTRIDTYSSTFTN